jgi:[acyl-carrier-protein] S-malonyltransferase
MFDLFAGEAAAEPVFAAAADVLGEEPHRFIHNADDAALHLNRNSQILCVTRSLAAASCLASAFPPRMLVAGYSVGEMAAWGIAGVWSETDTLRLTVRRAEIMDQASGADDALGFVRGLSRETVDAMASQAGCAIAIVNPNQLFIVGGEREDVERLCAGALAAGAVHAGLLPVKVASHTARLIEAVPPFERALRLVAPRAIARDRRLIGGAGAEAIFRPAEELAGLSSQLAHTIDWSAVLTALIEQGADQVLELGPGSALADMTRGASPSIRVRALDDFHSLDGARAWLKI